MPNIPDLPADFTGLTLFRTTAGEYQANLSTDGGQSWRCETAGTPDEALAALFEPVPAFLPPCPY